MLQKSAPGKRIPASCARVCCASCNMSALKYLSWRARSRVQAARTGSVARPGPPAPVTGFLNRLPIRVRGHLTARPGGANARGSGTHHHRRPSAAMATTSRLGHSNQPVFGADRPPDRSARVTSGCVAKLTLGNQPGRREPSSFWREKAARGVKLGPTLRNSARAKPLRISFDDDRQMPPRIVEEVDIARGEQLNSALHAGHRLYRPSRASRSRKSHDSPRAAASPSRMSPDVGHAAPRRAVRSAAPGASCARIGFSVASRPAPCLPQTPRTRPRSRRVARSSDLPLPRARREAAANNGGPLDDTQRILHRDNCARG